MQDRFNGTKACLRVFLAPFLKTLSKFAGYVHHGQSLLGDYSGYLDKNKMAAVGVSLTVFLQNTKSGNISKTVRDRAISSEFLTHRVVQEYSVAI